MKLVALSASGELLLFNLVDGTPAGTAREMRASVAAARRTISGSGFTDVSAVKFNGVAASTYTVDSSSQITAMVPLGASTGKISVLTAGGTAMSASSFIVTP